MSVELADRETCIHENFKIYRDNANPEDPYYIGVCMDCAAYQELRLKRLDEVFKK